MSKITEQFAASGVAQVIVVLEEPAGGAAAGGRRDGFRAIESHFTSGGDDQHSAIADDGFVDAMAPMPRVAASRRVSTGLAATARRSRRVATLEPVRHFPNLGIAYGVVDEQGLTALRKDRNVKSVTGAPQLSLVRPRTGKSLARPPVKVGWGLRRLGVPRLWAKGHRGAGVVIAHLDTGIDGKHRVFRDGAIGTFVEVDRLGRTSAPVDAYDTDDHGTHTAGTLVGRADRDGRAVGVAPEASLASAIVIEGGDSVARVLAGLDWSLGQGASILSMSLGFRGYVADFLPIVKILRQRGMLPVIAAGNEGPQTSRSPGNYTEALSVGWATRDDRVDPDSSSQTFRNRPDPTIPDLVGPGGDIVSAKPNGGYQLLSGTSMATPHIAGLAALLWGADPRATMDDIEAAIIGSCVPLPGVAPARQGQGMPDAVAALRILRTG